MSSSWAPSSGRTPTRVARSQITVARATRRTDRLDPQRERLDQWTAALSRGDDDEVDRLVSQSRVERVRATPPAHALGRPVRADADGETR